MLIFELLLSTSFILLETSIAETQQNNPEPIISIVYPYNNEYLPPGLRSVIVIIKTDVDADCQFSKTEFMYGNGINFTSGQGSLIHSFEILNLDDNSEYLFYYKSKNIQTNTVNTMSVIHRFSVYNNSIKLKIISNSVRVSVSHSGNTISNLLDNIPTSSFTTNDCLIWSNSNYLRIILSLPDKGNFELSKEQVSYFRFRSNNLSQCPNKYDILANDKIILTDCLITPLSTNMWVNIDLPDTFLTKFEMRIKGVQGLGAQKVSISDIEIFSTEMESYINQIPENGYLGISPWWNNLQWAYSLHVDDVTDVNKVIKEFGGIMPLTLQIMESDVKYGNINSVIKAGHEYGSHGIEHLDTSKFSYSQAINWLNLSKNYIEKMIMNTSRWSDNTVISFAYPFSNTNFYVTEAAYDVGFRISGQINNNEGKNTCWDGWDDGINYPRDEKDWMQIHRSLGTVKEGSQQFNDNSFIEKWKWIRDNGYFGDAMIHQGEIIEPFFKDFIINDKVGWRATWGEIRAYYYYSKHTTVNYNSSSNPIDKYIFDINIIDDNRISKWRVPITFIFNLSQLYLSENFIKSYLENDLNLKDIKNVQNMCEGYHIDRDILYLSLVKKSGNNIILLKQNVPRIIEVYPENNTIGIPLNDSIIVRFDTPINPTTFTFKCTPDPGNWSIFWYDNDTTVNLAHKPFMDSYKYNFEIKTVNNKEGNGLTRGIIPNPWAFTTIDCTSPYILKFYPENKAIDVLPNASIKVTFNEIMKPESIQLTCSPDPGNWTIFWSEIYKNVIFHHKDFTEKVSYTFKILNAEDLSGNKLIIDPESSTRIFQVKDTTAPRIITIFPENNSVDIPLTGNIKITFSEPMDITSIEYTIDPNPGNLSIKWSNNHTIITFSHDPFDKSKSYIFSILDARDLAGNELVRNMDQNIIEFTTISNTPPKITTKPITDGYVGKQYGYDVNAIDSDNKELRYYFDTNPEGMVIDPVSGIILWMPKINQIGENYVILIVSDNEDIVYQNFSIKVTLIENEDPVKNENPNNESPDNYNICRIFPIFFIIIIIAMIMKIRN